MSRISSPRDADASGAWPQRRDGQAQIYRGSGAWQGRTIAQEAWALAERAGDRVVMIDGERQITVEEAISGAEALAAGLDELGLRPGDSISYILPNWHEAVAINLAAARLGLIVNPIVPIYRATELRHILGDCRTRAIFIAETVRSLDFVAILDEIRDALPDLRHVVRVRGTEGLTLDALIDAGRGRPAPFPRISSEAIKLVMYTSGTTGPAKGVLHHHDSLARIITMGVANWGLDRPPVMLIATPIGHITGYLWGLEAPFRIGSRVVLLDRWDSKEAVRLIDAHEVEVTTGAAPFLRDTIEAAKLTGSRCPSLRRFGCGGAAVPPSLIQAARETFAQATAFRIYGSTEAPNITQGYADPADADLAAQTDGRPLDYEVRLIGADGRDVPDGVEGEIIARGACLARGYTDPSANEAFDPDGFFHTGDLGHRTVQGALVITGRLKDLIIRGGENLSAKEIEDALAGHPAVRDIAVVGKPDERLGEVVAAFVVPAEGARLSLADLATHLDRAGLARQKFPQELRLETDLPRTASGKVRKDILRARFSAGASA